MHLLDFGLAIDTFNLVFTNLLYLLPAYMLFEIGYHEIFASAVAVIIVSPLHHLCTDGGICFGLASHVLERLDVAFALNSIALAILSAFIYDLIPMGRIRKMINQGFNVRRIRKPPSSIVTSKATTLSAPSAGEESEEEEEEEYALIKHSYADIFILLYTFLTISLVFVFEGEELWIYVGMGIYGTLVSIGYGARFWSIKRKTCRRRFYWPPIVLSIVFLILSIFIFKHIEISFGRTNHGLWHVTGALTAVAFLVGTTGFQG